MSTGYPSNFRVNVIAGIKIFEFDKDPEAIKTTFHIEINNNWVFLGESDTDSFVISSSISGMYKSKGDSTRPNLPPPSAVIEDVDY
jgi:hypothetical protein